MKWTQEKDDRLRYLISIGKKHKEISEEFDVTIKSISNRCNRLSLTLVYVAEFECKHCNNYFIDYISSERKFCSKSCSNSYSNSNRTHSNETKGKISEKLTGYKHNEEFKSKISGVNNGNYIDGRSIDNKPVMLNGNRKCKICETFSVDKSRKRICEECKYGYYKSYRPLSEFDFDINLYKSEFDLVLLKEYGWYSPSNKGNNLNGVSRDHMYSVKDGFVNKVDPEIIKHPANCVLMKHSDNNKKNTISSITLEELKIRIITWDEKYK